jgi:hypothetical protein
MTEEKRLPGFAKLLALENGASVFCFAKKPLLWYRRGCVFFTERRKSPLEEISLEEEKNASVEFGRPSSNRCGEGCGEKTQKK